MNIIKPKVIIISGKANCGKDSFAKEAKYRLEGVGKKVLIIHYADLLKFVCERYFDWDGEKDERGRSMLQYVGTDVIRKQRPDFWVNFVCKILNMFYSNWDYVLIPDARFPNEIEVVKDCGFDVVSMRINRPALTSLLTEEQQRHESETALDSFEFDVYLSIGEGYENIKNMAKHFVEKWECIDEWCSFCEEVVEIPTGRISTCPNCGKFIKPCAMCDWDVVDCNNCYLGKDV